VKRLCEILGIAAWTPNRLRHNAATRFRKKFGIEIARLLLGHSKLSTTEIYAEPNRRKARMAARSIG
jgi:site-specific recombinase XerD